MQNRPLTELKNIGKTLAAKLNAIEVYNETDLKNIGAAKAYRYLLANAPDQRLPVCYYLYSLQGAIDNKNWRNLSDSQKLTLKYQAGLSDELES